MAYRILSDGKSNPKIKKRIDELGYIVATLTLSPFWVSKVPYHKTDLPDGVIGTFYGKASLCPKSTAECRAACLYWQGLSGVFPTIQQSRVDKTRFFLTDTTHFMVRLIQDLTKIRTKVKKHFDKTGEKKQACIRLNVESDIAWELLDTNVFELFSDVQFWDYTKRPERIINNKQQSNYHLTFSHSGTTENEKDCKRFLSAKLCNVAVVFHEELPVTYWGYPVIDGDTHDFRFLDPDGVVVGLRAKGTAKNLTPGKFVV